LQELELSPIPSNLQQLTVRVQVAIERNPTNQLTWHCISHLPTAAKVINAFASSLQRLTIEIDLTAGCSAFFLALVDFSPLAVVGTAPSVDSEDRFVCPHRHFTSDYHPRTVVVFFSGLRQHHEDD
jgi:hypothetical protein